MNILHGTFIVHTNADVHPSTEFYVNYPPRIGEYLRASNGVDFEVCSITHKQESTEIEVTPWFNGRTAANFDVIEGRSKTMNKILKYIKEGSPITPVIASEELLEAQPFLEKLTNDYEFYVGMKIIGIDDDGTIEVLVIEEVTDSELIIKRFISVMRSHIHHWYRLKE